MKIEPLQTIMSLSNNKKETLLLFLSNEIKQKVKDLTLIDSDYYINDKVYCIRKDNLQLEIDGKIVIIDTLNHESMNLGIQISNVRQQCIKTDEYYTFIQKKRKSDQRELMQELLKQL
jgi:hypothetical protein